MTPGEQGGAERQHGVDVASGSLDRQRDSQRVCERGLPRPAVRHIPDLKSRVSDEAKPKKKARSRSSGLSYPCGSEEEEILSGRCGGGHGVGPPNIGPTKERLRRRFALNREPRCSRSRPELTEVRGDPVLEELMRFSAHDALPPHMLVCSQRGSVACSGSLHERYHANLTRLGKFRPESAESHLEAAA